MPIGGETQDKDITFPFFFEEAVEDPSATKKAGGISQFVNVTMVRINIPGMRDEVCRPVEPKDKERWPQYWDRYSKGLDQKVDGTPFTEFTSASHAEIATLRGSGLQTVEQLAGLNEDAAQKMHFVALRTKAQNYLKAKAALGNVGALTAEIESLKKKIKELENANAPTVVSGRDEGDGVQPAVNDSGQSEPGQQAIGAARKRGRPRAIDKAQVA